MEQRFDPITAEVIKHAVSSIADEMAIMLMRSAYSAVVRDTMDYSTALCDRRGRVVAQGLTLAVQLGAFPDGMRRIVAEEAATARPGDVFVFNDPYGSGGQHLPDLYVIQPLFHDGVIEGYAATMAHHSDVGGIAPGSTAIHASEIHQEGLCLPLLKLYEAGRPNDTLFKVIAKNTRQPIQVIGDVRAQVAACRVGERRLLELLERYPAPELRRYLDALQDQAEAMMRAVIGTIPDGVYRYVDHIDGVGDDPEPLRIQVAVTVADDEIEIDLAGSAGQIEAAVNCPIAMVNSATYCAVRGLGDRDIPNCEGYMRPVRIRAPEGTVVNPVYPAACGGRGVIGYRVFDAIMGALAEAIPERVIAASEGGPSLFSIGGYDRGKPFVVTEVMVGTWGARSGRDGLEGVSNPAANLSNQPVELLEAEIPVEICRYGLVPDSGGAGRYRGGLAFIREYRLRGESAVFTVRSDRRRHRPYGIAGGGPGAGSLNVLNPGPEETVLPTMPMRALRMRRGDVFRHIAAGGGGFGDPLERNPLAVREDVLDGKVTVEGARRDYAVVISATGVLDRAATEALRAERRPGRAPG